MPQVRGQKDYLNLIKGLNTESNPLNFPEGFSADEKNFILSKNGDVRVRRKGLENTATDQTYTSPNGNPVVLGTHYWKNLNVFLVVLGVANNEVVVRVHKDDGSFTYAGEYEISATAGTGFKPTFAPILDGVVISGSSATYTKPILLNKTATDDIEIYSVDVYFRDFELVDDGLSVSQRAGSLSEEHTYNLYNAGWYAPRKNSSGEFVDPLSLFEESYTTYNYTATFTATDTVVANGAGAHLANLSAGDSITILNSITNDDTFTIESVDKSVINQITITTVEKTINTEAAIAVKITIQSGGSYPSNADVAVLGLKADGSGNEVFSADTLFETVKGSTEAPRGHYIFDVEESRTRDDVINQRGIDGSPSTTVTLEASIAL